MFANPADRFPRMNEGCAGVNCQMLRLAAEAQEQHVSGKTGGDSLQAGLGIQRLGQAIIDRQSAVALLVQVVGTEGSGEPMK